MKVANIHDEEATATNVSEEIIHTYDSAESTMDRLYQHANGRALGGLAHTRTNALLREQQQQHALRYHCRERAQAVRKLARVHVEKKVAVWARTHIKGIGPVAGPRGNCARDSGACAPTSIAVQPRIPTQTFQERQATLGSQLVANYGISLRQPASRAHR